jgi:hypothetical protein
MFGKKHYGKPMDKVPSEYLLWVAENLKVESWCKKADDEWQWREKYNEHVEDD